jgi:hypothetical protein
VGADADGEEERAQRRGEAVEMQDGRAVYGKCRIVIRSRQPPGRSA